MNAKTLFEEKKYGYDPNYKPDKIEGVREFSNEREFEKWLKDFLSERDVIYRGQKTIIRNVPLKQKRIVGSDYWPYGRPDILIEYNNPKIEFPFHTLSNPLVVECKMSGTGFARDALNQMIKYRGTLEKFKGNTVIFANPDLIFKGTIHENPEVDFHLKRVFWKLGFGFFEGRFIRFGESDILELTPKNFMVLQGQKGDQ